MFFYVGDPVVLMHLVFCFLTVFYCSFCGSMVVVCCGVQLVSELFIVAALLDVL